MTLKFTQCTFYVCFLVFFGLAGASSVQAQLKAVPDNFFIESGYEKDLAVLSNDNPGDCSSTPALLEVKITVAPLHADFCTVTSDNKIKYGSRYGFYGQDKFTYQIKCGAVVSTATVYINVGDMPDFISESECTLDPVPFVWDMEKKAQTTRRVQVFAQPFAGDLDGDGTVEIITANAISATNGTAVAPAATMIMSDSIFIFDTNLNMKKEFKVPRMASYITLAIALGDVDNDGQGEIIVGSAYDATNTAASYRLRAYTKDGVLKWTSSHTYFSVVPTDRYYSATVCIADIDGDGEVEILAGDRIFSGKDGKLLVTLPAGGGLGCRKSQAAAVGDGYFYCLADVTGDGKMEVVGGNTVYKITINRANPALSTATVLAKIAQDDGYTSVADIDGDGILDVIVVAQGTDVARTTKMYVWQGSSTALIGNVITNGAIGSRAFVGDINGDGKADIAFTRYLAFDAYSYNSTTKKFDLLFTVPTSDSSGATTMSMFDFNLDGQVELVYRDETLLRIIDKNGVNKATFTCNSGTHTEYPIIVDTRSVGDPLAGHAEIIVSGGNGVADPSIRLMKFGSKTAKTWAPARRVWNQHGYNPTTINENLSVPAHPLSPATLFARKDGSTYRPFNSFLQQAGVLNSEGQTLLLGPDLAIDDTRNQKIHYNSATNTLEVSAYTINLGEKEFTGNIKIDLYTYSKATGKYFRVGGTTVSSTSLAPYEKKPINFNIINYSTVTATMPAYDNWYIFLNSTANGTNAPTYYSGARECKSWNNQTSRISFISGELVLCQGEEANLQLDPANVYDCKWYLSNYTTPYNGADATNVGDVKKVKKLTSAYQEYYLIDAYRKGTSSKLSMVPDTAFVYLAPDTLVWNGSVNSDWHNTANWTNPGDPTKKQQRSYIPRGCTNVLIPKGLAKYPDLSAGVTDYSKYKQAKCGNISFQHGGELIRPDYLVYQKAFFDVELLSNRWYMFTVPLQQLYPGDIYVHSPNPFLDDVQTWTRFYSQTNPQTGKYVEGGWSGTFNTPDVKLNAGQGLGVYIDDGSVNYTQKPINFRFPKTDTEYNVYHPLWHTPMGDPIPLNRDSAYRFVFSPQLNHATREINLSTSATQAGKKILVGNPFMSHLDFKALYNYGNVSTLIEPYYEVLQANGTYATYNVSGVSTGTPLLTQYIAPMQSVLLTPKKAFSSIVANMSLSKPEAGAKLRSARSSESNQPVTNMLSVSISDDQLRSRTVLVYNEEAGLNYNSNLDVLKMIKRLDDSPVNVYTITRDGYYTDIKSISSLQGAEIPIGIRTSYTGPMALNFENADNFVPEQSLYLLDKETNTEIDLRTDNSIYCFNKTSSDVSLDNRFSLIVGRTITNIEETVTTHNKVYASAKAGLLEVVSECKIKEIRVYNLQGQQIGFVKPNLNRANLPLVNQSLYVVHVLTEKGASVLKVDNR